MNPSEKIDLTPNKTETSDDILGFNLDPKIVKQGEKYVERVEQIKEVPELVFNSNSTIFVCAPLYLELQNAERFFWAWNSQDLPSGVSIEVVVCINQNSDDQEDLNENTKTLELLQKLYEQNKRDNTQFHFIDNFSNQHRLNEENNIGDIRNILSASVVKSLLPKAKNGILFSTDADTFPKKSCTASLLNSFQKAGSCYGSVDKTIEFDPEIPESEQRIIRQLFLLGDVHEIFLEYFSSGKLKLPESMGAGGAGFFSSVDRFIEVGGYSSVDFGEDTDLLNKLYSKYPENFNPVLTPELSNTIRFSDRLEGDGALLAELRRNGYPANHTLDITMAHAKIRKWFSGAIIKQMSFEQALGALNIDKSFDFLSRDERDKLKETLNNKIDGENDDQKLEDFFRNLLKKLYEIKYEKIESAIEGYANFIKNFFPDIFSQITSPTNGDNLNDYEFIVNKFIEVVASRDEDARNK